MAGRGARNVHRSSDWWHSWLLVLGACSGFVLASLQPSITVAEGHDGELVSAVGPDFQLPADQAAALEWLDDAGVDLGRLEPGSADDLTRYRAASSRFFAMMERALAEVNHRAPPDADATPRPTTTTQQSVTTAEPTTTTAQRTTKTRPATTTTTTTTRPATTTTTTRPATTTTTTRPTTTLATTTTTRPTTTTSAPAQSDTAWAEERFIQLINQERSAAGSPALTVNADIRTVARNWTATMISEADGCHMSNLQHNHQRGEQMPEGVRSHAENIGCGQSVETLHENLMKSDGHRANILGKDFTDVGVGVGFDGDGTMWVTQIFAEL